MKLYSLVRFVSFSVLGALAIAASGQQALVNHGDSWRYRKGTNAPQADWKTAADGSLNAAWLTGNGGFGYANNTNETQLCQTLLSDMLNRYTTVYMRRSFTIASPVDSTARLQLTMDFDDGFIVWLDGNYLTNRFVAGAPTEPAFNTRANTTGHESSNGDTGPQAPENYDLGAVGARLGVGTHILAVIGLNTSTNSTDFIQIADLSVVTNVVNCISGPITVNTTWRATNSPINVCGSVTVNNGITLTIEAGTTVQLGSAVNITVANGGRLLAEGTSNAPIHFTRSGSSGNWGNITINGAAGSPETRIAYATFAFNSVASPDGTPCIEVSGGTAWLDHLTFGNGGAAYIHVDDASFVISHCYFPPGTAEFEPCHGTGGVRSDGHGIFLRNFFGKARGYKDVVDFTGGNRPSPIVHFIENVVSGGDDDGFDLDGTDAWVEGNIFCHLHRGSSTPDSASAVSGGNDGSDTSQITVVGNIMYDCDVASDAKQGNFYTLLNNTIVHMSTQGGIDSAVPGSVVITRDIVNGTPTTEGAGAYLEGNIIYDVAQLTRNQVNAVVTYTNNLIPVPWSGPGGSNSTANPLFKHVPQTNETYFTNWAAAQIMRDWFSLLPGSPGIGTGPNGRDKGGIVPLGASVSGAPSGTTTQTNATLVVGINRTGNSIPSGSGFWPSGAGYTAYKWRLDTNAWSGETAIGTPILVNRLADGPHYIEISGKRDSGLYQDDALFGEDAVVTRSPVWIVTHLRITSESSDPGNNFTLHFTAQAGLSYTVQYKTNLTQLSWLSLSNIPPQAVTGDYSVTDHNASGLERIYRVVTPAQP